MILIELRKILGCAAEWLVDQIAKLVQYNFDRKHSSAANRINFYTPTILRESYTVLEEAFLNAVSNYYDIFLLFFFFLDLYMQHWGNLGFYNTFL